MTLLEHLISSNVNILVNMIIPHQPNIVHLTIFSRRIIAGPDGDPPEPDQLLPAARAARMRPAHALGG